MVNILDQLGWIRGTVQPHDDQGNEKLGYHNLAAYCKYCHPHSNNYLDEIADYYHYYKCPDNWILEILVFWVQSDLSHNDYGQADHKVNSEDEDDAGFISVIFE